MQSSLSSNMFNIFLFGLLSLTSFYLLTLLYTDPDTHINTIVQDLPIRQTNQNVTIHLFVYLNPGEQMSEKLSSIKDKRVHFHKYACKQPISTFTRKNLTIECEEETEHLKTCNLFNALKTNTSAIYYGKILNDIIINEYYFSRLLNYLATLDQKKPHLVGLVHHMLYPPNFFMSSTMYFTNYLPGVADCESEKDEKIVLWKGRFFDYNLIDLSPYYFGLWKPNRFNEHNCKWIVIHNSAANEDVSTCIDVSSVGERI
eukprot:TRINITY_DN6359_c0_g1_i1.p1 TRINITY_DN6359_c0_g1~~TRINITY_DN6359_c0_g1_i1.p1  ORF type:complete len:258 (-),score=10.49 TRINITY_DN6359_c0_g1_i1:172-945(-)